MMGSVHPYETAAGEKRYRIAYRRPDHSQATERGFETKKAAQLRLAQVEVSKGDGSYINPSDSKVPVADLGAPWLKSQEGLLKASAYRPIESAWRIHVQPKWGKRAIGSLKPSEIQTWISELSAKRSATTTLRAYGILAALLDVAVNDRRIARNVARGLKLPQKESKGKTYLTHAQVEQLAAVSAYPGLVLFLAYTGLRWGEATGLRVKHLDALRRRVSVEENAVMVGTKIVVGSPKNHERRSVPYPEFLALPIASACENKNRDAILFGDGIDHMRLPNSRDGWFAAAVNRARAADNKFPRVTPHDLRHTAASLAVSAGANVKALQRMLGHKSAAMTLDTYADLFDDDLDNVAIALNDARTSARRATS